MLQQESQHTEWKETWCVDYLRWLFGFANAQGGRLLLGVNDKGQVVGLPDAAKLLEDLPNKARDLLGIVVDVKLHTEADLPYLELAVQAYPNPISYRGHHFMRSGSTLQELKGAALDRFLLGRHGRTWDGVPLPQVQPGPCRPRPWRGFASWPSLRLVRRRLCPSLCCAMTRMTCGWSSRLTLRI
ncbi:helix-turn-helix domain-containing protein [Limnohabitans sp.]|jgi:ATP-dependent DNA helicase RecG|uniref:helix-turn-helix domain-containing protein n=1 Tax=Limnohabitans sp. TaxID=1907725 RepID=UPI0037BEE596